MIAASLFLIICMFAVSGCAGGSRAGNESEADREEETPQEIITETEAEEETEKETEEETKAETEPLGTGEEAAYGVSGNGQLKVDGDRLLNKKGEPFQLKGVSTHGIAWFPQYVNADAFKWVKDSGGNVVRIAMYTATYNGCFNDPEGNMQLVCRGIDDAKALDMYVIVDWHILEDGDPNTGTDRAVTFFESVAKRYAGDPAVIYEICNEPNGVGWEAVKNYANAVIPVIRQYSPDALILVGSPDYSKEAFRAAEDPLTYENLMYTYHYYAGEHADYSLLEKAVDAGVPVFVSEWGIGDAGGRQEALEQAREFADMLNEKGISWCVWSLCNKDEPYSLLKPDCTKTGDFEEGDLSDAGLLIMEKLGR